LSITVEDLKNPPYWLVYGLPWPAGEGAEMAEAAFAFAPLVTPPLGPDARGVVQVADRYFKRYAERGRVVFFTDLTRFLTEEGSSWAGQRVDWENAFAQIGEGGATPVVSRYMTVSRRAHIILCDASIEGVKVYYRQGGEEQISLAERQAVREAFAAQLAEDWPAYIQGLVDRGRLRIE
jgi:hypothetical protein